MGLEMTVFLGLCVYVDAPVPPEIIPPRLASGPRLGCDLTIHGPICCALSKLRRRHAVQITHNYIHSHAVFVVLAGNTP